MANDAEERVKRFYRDVGWQTQDGIAEDTRRFEDLRACAGDYVRRCRLHPIDWWRRFEDIADVLLRGQARVAGSEFEPLRDLVALIGRDRMAERPASKLNSAATAVTCVSGSRAGRFSPRGLIATC